MNQLKKHWSWWVAGGYAISLLLEILYRWIGVPDWEIHWKLALILLTSVFTLGGFLLTIAPPWMSVILLLGLIVGQYFLGTHKRKS